MSKLRLLYVATEINPFLETTNVAKFVRMLPQAMYDKGMEIRIMVPRFGAINERRNRLHEVVRLSGINIAVGEEEKPLVIKVASIPNTRLQVYFIDNEDYFHRKSVLFDKDNNFYNDNDERAIYFCKGVLETVKKLGWAPDIIHCNDWMTGLIPMYIKTTYKNDPIFKNSKTLFSIFNNYYKAEFGENLADKVKMLDVEEEMLNALSPDVEGFYRVGAEYADAVVKSDEAFSKDMKGLLDSLQTNAEIPSFESDDEEKYVESHYNLYNELVG